MLLLLLANIFNSCITHSAAKPDKSAQTLHIDRRPKTSILFSKDYGKQLGQITTAGVPDRSTRENSVELYHENTAVAVGKTLVLQLTATRESVSQGISMSCSSARG